MEEIIEDLSASSTATATATTQDKNALTIRGNISKVETALTEFDRISAGLAELRERFPSDLVYDVTTTKGMAEAIAHRAAWRDPRITVEKFRKTAKAPVLALGKDIDARAAWLTEQLEAGEAPIDEQIQAELRRKEAEKQAKINAEFGRVSAIQDAIAEIHMDVMSASGGPSSVIRARLDELRAAVLDPAVFQEQMQQAEAARTAGVAKLELALKAKLHDEAEAARVAAERAELAELRRQAAEQKERDRVAAEAAAAEARQKAALVAALHEAESRRLREQAAKQAERDRQAAERQAALDRREADMQAREAAAAEAARKAAEPRPVAEAPVETLYPMQLVDAVHEVPAVAAASVPAPTEAPTLTLGEIQSRLAPVSITAQGLVDLGFPHAGTRGAAKLYDERKFGAMCDAISALVLKAKVSS